MYGEGMLDRCDVILLMIVAVWHAAMCSRVPRVPVLLDV